MQRASQDYILYKAKRLLARRKMRELIRLLEPEVIRYHDSYTYYHYLFTACLYAEDYSGANTYLKKAREIKMRSTDVLAGMAIIYLRRGNSAKAIECYLEIQDLEPKNKLPSKALKMLRKVIKNDNLDSFINSKAIKTLYPPLPRRFSFRQLIYIFIFALFLGFGLFYGYRKIKTLHAPESSRLGLEQSALEYPGKTEWLDMGGSFSRILTAKEIKTSFNLARKYFRDYRDEMAKIELNKILQSNAATSIKTKAEILKSHTTIPNFTNLKDKIAFEDVFKDPLLYQDCHVIWRGMATNLQEGLADMQFDLLVGYDEKTVLRGIVSVNLPFVANIELGLPIEILARLVILAEPKITIQLQGISIYQSKKLQED